MNGREAKKSVDGVALLLLIRQTPSVARKACVAKLTVDEKVRVL